MKGKCNTNRGLRFSDISNSDKSYKDARFRNLRVNSKDNLKLNNRNSNNINHRFGNPSNSIFNLRASSTRENHSTHSLMESLKEGRENIESRITRSLP